MSLYGALYAGVAGLQAQSNALGIISDNVANVNTVGYKEGSATFETLVTNSSGATAYSPGGVLGGNQQLVSQQGLLQTTSSPTDVAISGNGLFVVNQTADGSGDELFTRAGSFTQDAQGNFVNSAGYYLQAWPLDRNGNLPGAPGNLDTTSSANLSSLETVNVQNLAGTAAATTDVSLGANLNAGQTVYPGSAGTAAMNSSDIVNSGISANELIVPDPTDNLAIGDQMTISTGSGLSYDYNYGGFTTSRSVDNGITNSGTSADYGSSGQPVQAGSATLTYTPATLNTTAMTVAAGGISTSGNGDAVITVTVSPSQIADLHDGDYVNISGLSSTLDTITGADMDGNFQISNVNTTTNTFTYVANGSDVSSTAATVSLESATITPEPLVTGTSSANTPVTISDPATGLAEGDYVTINGGSVDGVTLNGTYEVIGVPDANHITIASNQMATAGDTPGGSGVITATPEPMSTVQGSPVVTIYQPNNGLTTGDVVTLANIPSGGVGGIPATDLTGSFVVTVVDADHYQITAVDGTGTAVNATSSTSGGDGTEATMRPFVGNILDATNSTSPFLGTTGTSAFSASALTFTISSAISGTVTFTYTSAAPNAQLQQFNTLTNLADAINSVNGLTARVVSIGGNSRLYVGSTDADDSVSFQNGATVGSSGPPVLAPINWVGELGLSNVGPGTNRFSTLQSLADQVNNSSGLTATVDNPVGTSSLAINVNDPLDTIDFTNATGNQGNVLAQLGLVSSKSTDTTGNIGPAYDPTKSTNNMASGAIPSQFSRPITIYDAEGTAHNLNVAFLKTGTNTWAVEVYAQPASDVTSSNPDGQIAFGTLTFNGDGSLRSVSSGLSSAAVIDWTNGSTPSTVSFDWGTAGQPSGTPNATVIGGTNGLSQFDSDYNVNFANQNGAPVGQLTGVSIDQNGYITASYNNGETQKLYKIPLAEFTDPNQLQSISGNAYAQTSDSGEVSLKQAGTSGVGTISSGALESSNVELADQLTNMIVAQRAYQANTKVISTADELLNDLDQILQ